jgi:hypothetical protein
MILLIVLRTITPKRKFSLIRVPIRLGGNQEPGWLQGLKKTGQKKFSDTKGVAESPFK